MIRELPIKIINLLKAGEVVEKPSSVVKELVENSIDAESKNIVVRLINAGIDSLEVIDDGCGMSEEDLKISVKQHTTSKIYTEEDLYNVSTNGFRGEALASIKAVSRLTITSALNDGEGYEISYLGEELIKSGYKSRKKGTTIKVTDLFFNHPVRKKSLKTPGTELSSIVLTIERLAVANPNISFKLVNNDSVVFETIGNGNVLDILGDIYGYQTVKHLKEVSFVSSYYKVSGYITDNNIFRSNKQGINILVNKRIVQNRNIIFAIQRAYESIIPIGKSPIVLLSITSPKDVIDVNVHPNKLEIKFTDEETLIKEITSSIRTKLYETNLSFEAKSNDFETVSFDTKQEQKSSLFSDTPKVYRPETTVNNLWDSFKTADNEEKEEEILQEEPTTFYEESKKRENFINDTIEDIKGYQTTIEVTSESKFSFSKLTYIGQYHKTYLILTDEENLYLIDQHAAMERCRYEQIKKELERPTTCSITPLIPLELDLSKEDLLKVNEHLEELDNLHIKLNIESNKLFIISYPGWIMKNHEQEILLDMINDVINSKETNRSIQYENLARMIACKSSIKGNMNILREEVSSLLYNLDQCEMPFTCPHGRPTLVKVTSYEVEKMFKRVI